MMVWAFAGKLLLPKVAQKAEFCLYWSSALALGAGLTTVAVTMSVTFGVFGRPAAWGIAVFVFALAVGGVIRTSDDVNRLSIAWRSRQRLVALSALFFLGIATLLATLAPPSSMDATVYHLRVAREFLQSGHWTDMPDVAQSYQPLYVQMLFAEGLALGDDVFAALMHWALGVGAVLTAGAWSRRLGASALWGMVVFGMAALFAWESTSAFVDLALTLFSSLALLWATQAEEPEAVWLAAVFAGLAAGSKLTGGIVAIQVAILVAWFSPHGRRYAARQFGLTIAVAFSVALPWYLRNVMLTGNPIFPLANVWLHLPPIALAASQYGYGHDLLHFLTSPFDLVWRGDAFDKGWALGPAYLALVPLGIRLTWKTQLGRPVVFVLATWWAIWFFSSPQTRLLLPVLPAAAALASVGAVAALASSGIWLRRATIGILIASSSVGAAFSVSAVKTFGNAAIGRETRDVFLSRMSWHYLAFQQTNARLSRTADQDNKNRLAVIGADNLYYLRVPATTIRERPSLSELKALGFSHVLHIHPCSLPGMRVPETLWQGRYRLILSRMGSGTTDDETCAELGKLDPAQVNFALGPSDIR